ncbi:hypothetical protein [Paraliomyxa miuraensis]|uniref:hypothetical protein n=1 Tax=Paraliomyxa miuraensis TaxID=376150 RepID=UPI002259EEBA|nr:hypothetical protein [Paraliomyxa miuraensis]MCX4246582.1 hypothetical protein [Paraliomyxa miuraensis]
MSDPDGARPRSAPAIASPIIAPDRRFLLVLVVLALLTRLIWVLWVHPPGDYVFSDMKKYVERAQDLAVHGWHPERTLAWQAWGTHYLLAIPLRLFGPDALVAGAVTWGLMGAAAVPAGYLLSCRVSTWAWMPKVVGVALLLWWPSLSNGGYFLSEAPFLCFQLWSTLGLVVVLQEGRRPLLAGLASAVAFAVRPQSAMFFVLVLVTWAVNRKRLPRVGWRQLVLVALPLLLMLGYSTWRFHYHTGRWAGVAENANMNLTAGRCHNIVTQAFPTEHAMRRSERDRNTRNGRRVSLPAFRVLAASVPPSHPLALRPAMGGETIRMVGYIGDAEPHRELRAECYRRTGVLEQLRYSVVNASLLWFVGHQWPEQSKNGRWLQPPAEGFKYLFQVVVWFPSLLGLGAGLWWIRRRPGLTFCAWQLMTSITVAAIFFGTIRLRTPYDPYAIILALEGWVLLGIAWARWRARKRPHHTSASASENASASG